MSEPRPDRDPSPRAPGLTILHHPELDRIGERAALLGLGEGQSVRLSRREPAFGAPGASERRSLERPELSRRPLRIRSKTDGSFELDVTDTRTHVEVDGQLLEGRQTFTPENLKEGVVLRLGSHVVLLWHLLDPVYQASLPRYGLVGESHELERVRREIQRVSDLDVAVMIRGETGTGKEMVAQAIHEAGPRRHGPFVAVNMAAIPPELAAAELFGALRGAYTGADRRRHGLFQRADGGTLFLDEVGETPREMQALLLRALETHEVRPVGSEESHRVDVRVISATDANLEDGVADRSFRAPLFHRLAGFDLRLPPLRHRREDFGRLLIHFLRRELEAVGERGVLDGAASSPWLSADLVVQLVSYDWPGNVRQLINVVRQIVIASRGESRALLPESVETLFGMASIGLPSAGPAQSVAGPTPRKPSELDDDRLVELLRSHRFNLRAAAVELRISPTSLYSLIEKSPRLRKPSQISREEIERHLARAGGNVESAALGLEVSCLGLKRRLKELGLR